MRVSTSWLREYCDFPDATTLASRLTMAGLEVEAVERQAQKFERIVAARVEAIAPHPSADKLARVRVSIGDAHVDVVCGATNFKVGDLVALAKVGSRPPGTNKVIAAAEVRGVVSEGMLCSPKELGVSADALGLLILEPTTVPGTPLTQVLGLDDTILTLNVTPNRGDALSHLGVAREVATLFHSPIRLPSSDIPASPPATDTVIGARREDPRRCWRYALRAVEGIRVEPSPLWMQRRLEACGMRAISNVVDITNYVMLETGQPLHAFDLDKIQGAALEVRNARPGETLTTLDGVTRTLVVDDLLIADSQGPLVIAGVMGGARAEVTAATTRIVIESACFDPVAVRRASKRHGLPTESARRFERGVSVSTTLWALDRAAALMAELAHGKVRTGVVDLAPVARDRRVIRLTTSSVRRLLGIEVSTAECARILVSLGFSDEGSDAQGTSFGVPDARSDVAIEEDLIEEVARVRGYDAIPAQPLRGFYRLEAIAGRGWLADAASQAMRGQGFDEAVNFSFVAPAQLQAFEATAGAIKVSNPMSVEMSVMRTTLLPSLVANIARAVRHHASGVRFFELARTYHRSDDAQPGKPVVERLRLAAALWGLRARERHWLDPTAVSDFYDAKAAVEAVLQAVRAPPVRWEPREDARFHPRSSTAIVIGKTLVGSLGEIHPRAAIALRAPRGIYALELDLDALAPFALDLPRAVAVQRFPSVLRDLAVVVDEAVSAEELRQVILDEGKPLVVEASVFDVYRGPQLGEGKKNLAFALTYASPDRTLTDEEVAAAHSRIVAEVVRRAGAMLRT